MSYVRRVASLTAACVAGALLAVTPAAAAQAAAPPPATAPVPAAAPPASAPSAAPGSGAREFEGTYQLLAKDIVRPDGTLRDVYSHILQVGGKAYRLRLPKGTKLKGGTPVRVRGTLSGADLTADEVQVVGAPYQPPTTGTTKVLAILVYWTAPDSMSVTKVKNQLFNDDHAWFGESSYGQLGLTGTAVGWYKILAPTGGHCYANHMEIMDRAQAKAKAAGHDPADYQRTMVYFPACGGDAGGAAGWAYQPGNEVWMNGYFDRRVSVHEQGHNYGLAHAHTYHCKSGSVDVTLGGSCSFVEYGDNYDAMGGSDHAAHFGAPQKDQVGWLGSGRKRVLTSTETTFTLPPFEKPAASPVAAVVTSSQINTRKYWIEHRQAVGYDNTLPAGATDGVLVRMTDSAIYGGGGPFLLDMSPHTPFTDAVIPPGGAWTSPDGIRITVGSVGAAGAVVTVKGGAAPATVPTVPRNLAATGGDGSVRVSWDPPASNGGATVQSYVVTGTPGPVTATVDGATRTATIGNLTNGTAYSFTVVARNAVGTSPVSASAPATPTAQLPTVAVSGPVGGTTLSGTVTVTATATPHPVSGAVIEYVSFEVDGEPMGWDDDGSDGFSAQWDTSQVADGPHELTATAYDANWRHKTSAPVTVSVLTPRPTITILTPHHNSVITADLVELSATSAPAPNGGAEIQWVSYELTDGTPVGYADATEGHVAYWDTFSLDGTYDLVAKVHDAAGRTGTSAPVRVTVQHPKPSVTITAPADGVTVNDSVTVAASATPNPDTLVPINRVDFATSDGTHIGTDYDAPYSVQWDTSALAGELVVVATAHDDTGRSATSPGRTVIVSNPLPSAAIVSPSAGQVFAGPVTFSASAAPNPVSGSPIARVVFALNGVEYATDTTAPYSVTWDSGDNYGAHSVSATAYDAAGRAGRAAPVTFTVKTPTPTVTLTRPTAGSVVASGERTIAVMATQDPRTPTTPFVWAEFIVDGEAIGWDDFAGDGFSTRWLAMPGEHTITARVYDDDFYYGDALPVTVQVVDLPGAPSGVTATAGGDGTATVSWTAPDNGGSPILDYLVVSNTGAEHVAADSPFEVPGLTNGTAYSFRVKARTAAGFGELSAATAAVVPGTRTALAIALSRTTVNYGTATAATATLTRTDTGGPVAGRVVELLACPTSTTCATVVGSGTTSDLGKATIAYVPKQHRYLRVRFAAGGRFLAATSAAKRVTVRAVVTSAISRTSVVLGKGATVSGKVIPAHSGKRVYLQRLTSSGWRNVTYRTQTTTGTVSFAVRPTTKGTHRYRLYFAGDSDHLAGTSPSRSLRVT